jgi:membrane protein implicated in regulation of membrane protease activity
VLSFTVVIHMEISRSDIRSGLRGLAVLAAMFLIADLVLGFMFPTALAWFTGTCVKIGVGSLLFLLMPLAVSAMIGAVSIIVLMLRAMFGARARAVAVNHHRISSKKGKRKRG